MNETKSLLERAEKYLEDRAKRGSKKKFMEALSKVPDVEPEECDKL